MKFRSALLAMLLAALSSCAGGPVPIVLGDACRRCHMTVGDERWGAELITVTGVIRKYDSVECLARDVADGSVDRADIASLWVVPWDAPGTLVPAQQAVYRQSPAVRSPMGGGIAAFQPGTAPPEGWMQPDDLVLDWAGVLAVVRNTAAPRHVHGTTDAH